VRKAVSLNHNYLQILSWSKVKDVRAR
jgi:hypothetical protein